VCNEPQDLRRGLRLDGLNASTDDGLADPTAFPTRAVREQSRLQRENEELRQRCAELTRAAETWIRLYEAALARANAAEEVVADLSGRTRMTERAS